MKLYTDIDLRYNEVQNVNIQTDIPNNPIEGTIYYSTSLNRIRYYDGTQWISIGAEEGGGGGEENLLEQVYINGNNLRINNNKEVRLAFSSTGNGDLTIKDTNRNANVASLTIGGGSGGVEPENITAAGTLQSGHRIYTVKHSLGTDAVIVQVIDNSGYTVECNVRRYTSGSDHYVEVSFSKNTTQNYRIIIIGNPKYSLVNITTS